jgi:uncharacterized membrane protein YphA (DoxX/SURF4 family)
MERVIERAGAWTASKRVLALDILRVYLGIGLFARGLFFLAKPEAFTNYLTEVDWLWSGLVTHYVIAAHLAGGLLLALGFRTRLAAGVQVPALLGAVFLVHLREGLMVGGLELSALVLLMLVVYTVVGAGPLSLDYYLSKTPAAPYEPSAQEDAFEPDIA